MRISDWSSDVCSSDLTQRPNYNVEGWIVDMTPQQRFDAFKNAIQSFAQLSRLDWQKDGFDFLANPDWGNPGVDKYVGIIKAWNEGCANSRQLLNVDAALVYKIGRAHV